LYLFRNGEKLERILEKTAGAQNGGIKEKKNFGMSLLSMNDRGENVICTSIKDSQRRVGNERSLSSGDTGGQKKQDYSPLGEGGQDYVRGPGPFVRGERHPQDLK